MGSTHSETGAPPKSWRPLLASGRFGGHTSRTGSSPRFSIGELERLLALADPRERALTLLLLDTGLRLAEVAALCVGDLRPDGTIRVLGKGAKEGIVRSARPPGEPSSATSPDATPSVQPTLSSSAATAPPLSRRGIQYAIARLGRRAGVSTRSSPHAFRHTFARGYLVNGGDVFSLQQILGHATLDMVRRYARLAGGQTWSQDGHRMRSGDQP